MKKIIHFFIILIAVSLLVLRPVQAQDYRQLFQQASEYAQKGDMEEAIKLYEKVLKLNPNFAPAYNNLGLAYREIGLDPVEVAWYFKNAIDVDPKFEDAYINLGKSYYGLGHFDLAEHYTLKALELNPSSAQAKLSLGWIYLLGKSRPQDAIKYFEELAETWQNPSAYFGLGMAYFMVGESPRTLECITKLREMQQDSLALQLETVIRGYEYMPGAEDAPLLQEAQTKEDPLAKRPQSQVTTSTNFEGPTQITVTGTIPVRLSGKLVVDPPAAVEQPKSGVLKR
jgi:tetratricopeptide (TPR) repeat protein